MLLFQRVKFIFFRENFRFSFSSVAAGLNMTTACMTFQQSTPPLPPRPSLWSSTTERNVAGGARRVTLPLPVQSFGNAAPGPRSVPQPGGQRVGPNLVAADVTRRPLSPRRRGDVGTRQPCHGSPCLCRAQRRPSQQAGGQPAVLSCPTSWEAECNSSFARVLYRLMPEDVRNN